jgi:hypothetical protein
LLNGAFILLIPISGGILIGLPISLFESFLPAGLAGKYGGVEDTNNR